MHALFDHIVLSYTGHATYAPAFLITCLHSDLVFICKFFRLCFNSEVFLVYNVSLIVCRFDRFTIGGASIWPNECSRVMT